MADLSFNEELMFEELFEMESGYVIDFSTPTFQRFVIKSIGIDIQADAHRYGSGSKANRLRGLWLSQPNHIVGKLLFDLVEYWKAKYVKVDSDPSPEQVFRLRCCEETALRLLNDAPTAGFESVESANLGHSAKLALEAIKESLRKGEPEMILDRLHVFSVTYFRKLLDDYAIVYDNETPLHSLVGMYVKAIKSKGVLESKMAERIIKSAISLFESLNEVRNRHSLAHPNQPLNRTESTLIVSNMANVIQFIHTIECDFDEVETSVVDQPASFNEFSN
jgi:hypothetical protein